MVSHDSKTHPIWNAPLPFLYLDGHPEHLSFLYTRGFSLKPGQIATLDDEDDPKYEKAIVVVCRQTY
jgi:hypothetical protein